MKDESDITFASDEESLLLFYAVATVGFALAGHTNLKRIPDANTSLWCAMPEM